MKSPIIGKQMRQYHPIWWVALLMAAIFLTTGCIPRVKLVGEYDQVVDQMVTELQQETKTFFSKMQTGETNEITYEANKAFYDQSMGKVSTLILRAEVIEDGLKRNPITRNFRDLRLQYEDLAKQHRAGASKMYFKSAEKAFDQSFRAIMENILYLKWNQTQPE